MARKSAQMAGPKSGGVYYTDPNSGTIISDEYYKLKYEGDVKSTIKYSTPTDNDKDIYDKYMECTESELSMFDASLSEQSVKVRDNTKTQIQSCIYNFGYPIVGSYSTSFETI